MIVLYSLILVLHHYLLLSFQNCFSLLQIAWLNILLLQFNKLCLHQSSSWLCCSKLFEACIISNFHFGSWFCCEPLGNFDSNINRYLHHPYSHLKSQHLLLRQTECLQMVLDINPHSWELLATEIRKYKKKLMKKIVQMNLHCSHTSFTHSYVKGHNQPHYSTFTETGATNQMTELTLTIDSNIFKFSKPNVRNKTIKSQLLCRDAYTTKVSLNKYYQTQNVSTFARLRV